MDSEDDMTSCLGLHSSLTTLHSAQNAIWQGNDAPRVADLEAALITVEQTIREVSIPVTPEEPKPDTPATSEDGGETSKHWDQSPPEVKPLVAPEGSRRKSSKVTFMRALVYTRDQQGNPIP